MITEKINADLHPVGNLAPRIERAAEIVDDLDEQLRAARELRNQLIVQAVDEGMSTAAVARAAGVTQSRVMALLAERRD